MSRPKGAQAVQGLIESASRPAASITAMIVGSILLLVGAMVTALLFSVGTIEHQSKTGRASRRAHPIWRMRASF